MNKRDLLFYDAYEEFYKMTKESKAFQRFCEDAFGEDFSQDGFSNINQVNMILQYIHQKENVHILDIGCGNGKMLGYLQRQTGAYIHGFDYSGNAIETARELFPVNAEFEEAVIGEIDYPAESFEVIISMDTMYFAKDMVAFVSQIKKWLKKDGVFFVGYQEGDVMAKTENADTTVLAKALLSNGMQYEVTDITRETYDLLKVKRVSALENKEVFEVEGHQKWYEMLMGQTECVCGTFEEFERKMKRYVYVVRKKKM